MPGHCFDLTDLTTTMLALVMSFAFARTLDLRAERLAAAAAAAAKKSREAYVSSFQSAMGKSQRQLLQYSRSAWKSLRLSRPPTRTTKVKFSTVNVRTHELILGARSECVDGLPLGLGWKYSDAEESLTVDEFEAIKNESDGKKMKRLSLTQRKERLVEVGDYTESYLKKRVKRKQMRKRLRKLPMQLVYKLV